MLKNIEQSKHLSLFQRILAEYCGTFVLVFSVGVTQGDPTSVAPALWGGMLATGFISGAQFNPAVSVAVFVHAILSRAPNLSRKLAMTMLYITVQVLTGLFAAYMAYKVINTDIRKIAYFDVASGYTNGQGFLAEFIFTTVLTGLAIIGGNFTKSNILAGGLVAVCVSAGDFSVGKYTGGCFNPAVGFGINMVEYAVNGNSSHNVWLYIIAPTCGGVLGGFLSSLFMAGRKEMDELRKLHY